MSILLNCGFKLSISDRQFEIDSIKYIFFSSSSEIE